MRRSVRRVLVVSLVAPCVLAATAGAALADGGTLVSTPEKKAPGPGGSCLFIGQATVYNPLTQPYLFTTDPDTGFYVNCNDVG